MYGVRVGHGAHWASRPAATAPSRNPAVMVRDARLAATAGGTMPVDSSRIQVVPTTMATATETPESKRPTIMAVGLALPSASTAAAATLRTTDATMRGLRPKRSESEPAMRKPGMSPMM